MKLDKSNIHKYITATTLYCSNMGLTSIESIPDHIIYINCQYNNLTSLPTLPSGLISLSCYNNNLTSLPYLPDSLIYLDCSENLIIYPTNCYDRTWMDEHNNRLKLINRINIINKIYN